jgi:hypothetical protein
MNTMHLIIGNLCSLLAMLTDSISSTRKTSKDVLRVQNISQLIYCIGTVILKGYSGAVQNAVSFLRNLAAIHNVQSKAVQWVLAALGVVLGVAFNNLGLIGLLPVAANLGYTIAVFRFQNNERALKTAFMICVFCFSIFNIALYNVVGVASNTVVAVTAAISLIKTRKKD